MRKYKVELPANYKSYFTLADIESVNEVKKDMEFVEENIACLLEVLAQGDAILKCEIHWDKGHGINSFFGNGIELLFDVVLWNGSDEFRTVCATSSQINEIGSVSRDCVGYQRIFKPVDR